MSNSDKKVWGWVAIVAGIVMAWNPIQRMNMMARVFYSHSRISIFRKTRFCFRALGGIQQFLLLGGLLAVAAGIIVIIIYRDKKPLWQSKSPLMKGSVRKKIMKLTNVAELTRIANAQQASPEIRKAAEERRKAVLQELLDSGSDEDIRREVGDVVSSGMYDPVKTEFLAEAAKKHPAIIKEFWPRLQSWAHSDSKSHTDKPGGFHTDRTEYYDYIRYPDGRTVANKKGRQRHTDSRGSYSDCHDDRHQDSSTHIDNPHDAKIARFKPYIPDETDGQDRSRLNL